MTRFMLFVFVLSLVSFLAWRIAVAHIGDIAFATESTKSATEQLAGFSLENTRELEYHYLPSVPGYSEFYPSNVGMQANSLWTPEVTIEGAWGAYTVEERMLANGYEVLQDDGTPLERPKKIRPVATLVSWIASFYHAEGRMPESNEDLLARVLDLMRERIESGDISEDEVRDNFYSLIVSPVTGKALEWQHQDFSPGNAFITVINANPDAYAEAMRRLVADEENEEEESSQTVEKNDAELVHVYWVVYGNSGVIDSKETVITNRTSHTH